MIGGYPKGGSLVVPVSANNQRIALSPQDAEIVVLEFTGTWTGVIVDLPDVGSVPKGKRFTIQGMIAPQTNFGTESETFAVQFWPRRSRGTPISWLVGWGQCPTFLSTDTGWVSASGGFDDGVGTTNMPGTALGFGSMAGWAGTAVGRNANGADGVALGDSALGNTIGTAVGKSANGSSGGAAVGNAADGNSSGAAFGANSNGVAGGAALGAQASSNSKGGAVALGRRSRAQRQGEVVHGADVLSTTLRSFSFVDWWVDTSNATPTEALMAGASAQRCTVLASSAFVFSILAVARDTVNNVVSSWKLEGCIKRDASNNTALVGAVTKTVIAQDGGAAAWDIAATADDTNEALALTVTGAASTTIRWNAMATISEVRF